VRRTYEIGGKQIGVRTTSVRFGTWLDQTLSRYRVDVEVPAEYSVVVDGGRPDDQGSGSRFNILYRGTVPLARSLELRTVGRALIVELESARFQEREDAIYARVALFAAGRRCVLAPWWVLPYVVEMGRRARRAGIDVPTSVWVAIDPESGELVSIRPTLRVSAGALHRLDGSDMNPDGPDRVFSGGRVDVDSVMAYRPAYSSLRQANRGYALYQLAGSAVNLPTMGGRALGGLARLVEKASCYELGSVAQRELLESLGIVLRIDSNGSGDGKSRYAVRRSRDTARG
jgi:hypothetical protein